MKQEHSGKAIIRNADTAMARVALAEKEGTVCHTWDSYSLYNNTVHVEIRGSTIFLTWSGGLDVVRNILDVATTLGA